MKINTGTTPAPTPAPASRKVAVTNASQDVKKAATAEAMEASKPAEAPQEKVATADKLMAEVEQAVQRVREAIKPKQSTLEFNIEEPDKQVVITVRDKDTGDVVRQIPSEEMLRIAHDIENGMDPAKGGVFIKKKV